MIKSKLDQTPVTILEYKIHYVTDKGDTKETEWLTVAELATKSSAFAELKYTIEWVQAREVK